MGVTRSGSTWTQQGKKLGERGDDSFGSTVALSADGNTALSGDGSGKALVFTRSGSTWKQQSKELTASGEACACGFAWSVALSANGNTALIGGNGTDAAWVYRRH